MSRAHGHVRPPNNALQRTRAAVLLQSVPAELSTLGCRRAPLSFKPFGDGKRFPLILTLVLVFVASALAAQGTSGSIGLTTPEAPWILPFPGEGFAMREQKIKPDGRSGYFYLTNDSSHLNVSFFIEPAQKCKSSAECRDMVQKAGFAHMGKVENVRAAEIGDVSTVECFLPEAKGMPVKQQHLFAEFVVQGYWVDMHISKVLYSPADRQLFEQLVKAISFVPKKKDS